MAAPRRTLPPLVLVILLLLGTAIWLVSQDTESPAVRDDTTEEIEASREVGRRDPAEHVRSAQPREHIETPKEATAPTPGEPGDEADPRFEFPDAREPEPRTIHVTVLREDGGPERGAHVAAAQSFGSIAITPAEEVTGVDGTATLELPGNAMFRVRAWTPDSAGFSERITLAAGATTSVTVRLAPGRTVKGIVVSAAGGPEPGLPGAKVRLGLASDDPFGLHVTVQAGDGGAFDFGVVPDAPLLDARTVIRAEADRHAPLEVPLRDQVAMDDVRLEMQPGQTVRGRCVTRTGAPAAGVPVWLGDTYQRSADDGGFLFTGGARTGGTLLIRPRNYVMPAPVEVPAGLDEFDVGDVLLEVGRPISGIVVDAANAPVAGATVHAWHAEWNAEVASATANEEGSFEVKHIGEGEHTLVVGGTAGGWTSKMMTTVEGVTAGTTGLRVVLTGGLSLLIAFKKESDRSVVTVASAEVSAWRTDIETNRHGQAWAGANIETVRIVLDAPGTYAIEVSVPGYQPATVEGIEIAADRETRIDALLRERIE